MTDRARHEIKDPDPNYAAQRTKLEAAYQAAADKLAGTAPVTDATLKTNLAALEGPKVQPPVANGITPTTAEQFIHNYFSPADPNFLIRRDLVDLLIDPRRELDREFGWPEWPSPLLYEQLFVRNAIANRVCRVLPEESWAVDPEIFETTGDKQTAFESAWVALAQRLNLWQELEKIDILSGIGRFGVLFLGINDGKDYTQPIDGIDEFGNVDPEVVAKNELLFVRSFHESVVRVNLREGDMNNPRFGQPKIYTLLFKDLDVIDLPVAGVATVGDVTKRVHWSRVIHVADNLMGSKIYGTPRCEPVANHIFDLRKTYGASAEGIFRGAVPGLAFELNPGLSTEGGNVDWKSLKEETQRYVNGMSRTIALAGMTAKSLPVQPADPGTTIDAHLDAICVQLGVPKRVFLGSERGELASTQDAKAWIKRLRRRQNRYVSPMVIRPFVERLIAIGVLPKPKEFFVEWPPLETSTVTEQSAVAVQKSQAIAQYVQSGSEQVMPPDEFLELVVGIDPDDVAAIAKAREEYVAIAAEDPDNENVPVDDEKEPSPMVPVITDAAVDQQERP